MGSRFQFKNVTHLGTEDTYVNVDKLPNACPICHLNQDPKYVAGIRKKDDPLHISSASAELEFVFRCTNDECESLYICLYDQMGSHKYDLRTIRPVTPKERSFTEEIKKVSPEFIEIYNQSEKAKAKNLNQIYGIGLRKALEFLVKDYAKYLERRNRTQESEEELENVIQGIERSSLSQAINNYFEDTIFSRMAERAAWLGNDQTHYLKKWDDRDVGDLEELIDICINQVENNIKAHQYEEEMKKD